jgi:hypothetical protein
VIASESFQNPLAQVGGFFILAIWWGERPREPKLN